MKYTIKHNRCQYFVERALFKGTSIKGTSIYCREKPGDKADGAEKPECTRRT